jgi:8-oxo-dGTP pyrophosphatase MutT (NUDIX family)
MHTVFSKNKILNIPDEEWGNFCSGYTIVEAGGGLVQNSRGEYLMIFRNGKWDLPKGKREPGESTEQNALREVEEECSIDRLRLEQLLLVTHHTYTLHGADVLKPTHWYAMRYEGNASAFTPQQEEGIELAEFISREKILTECFNNTHDSIKAVFAAAGVVG